MKTELGFRFLYLYQQQVNETDTLDKVETFIINKILIPTYLHINLLPPDNFLHLAA